MYRLAISKGITEGRDASVWVDLEEPWLLLDVLRNVDLVNVVWEPEGGNVSLQNQARWRTPSPKLFQSYGNFDAVWSLGRVQVDVRRR